MNATVTGVEILSVGIDHPDVAELVGSAQRFYREVYGQADRTPLSAAEFRPPRGDFQLGYVTDPTRRAVVAGGWRSRGADEAGLREGDAELKRMFVREDVRGKGYARALLASLEASAAAAGRRRVVLETGTKQPAAIGLYTSSGYTAIPKFGYYRREAESRCYAKVLY
jgi:GNAT superfamily N-acetyltransferase